MSLRFTIRDLLWLTVGTAGAVAMLIAMVALSSPPVPISTDRATQIISQALGGWAVVIIAIVFGWLCRPVDN